MTLVNWNTTSARLPANTARVRKTASIGLTVTEAWAETIRHTRAETSSTLAMTIAKSTFLSKTKVQSGASIRMSAFTKVATSSASLKMLALGRSSGVKKITAQNKLSIHMHIPVMGTRWSMGNDY